MRSERRHNRLIELLVLAESIVGVMLVLVATSRYGAGTSPDSAAYVSTARSLLSSQRFVAYDGNPWVFSPPLFPTLLAMGGLVGIDPLDAARFINAISFGLIILAADIWLLKHIKSTAVMLMSSIAIVFSIPLMRVSVFAWSEPVFILLTILFVLEIEEFQNSGKYSSLVLSAAFASLATLERYIGVTVILTGLILLILQQRAFLIRRFANVIIFGVIPALPISVWVARNVLVSSTLTGARWPSPYTLTEHIYNALDAVTSWFLPSSSSSDAAGLSSLPQSLQSLLQSVMLPPPPRFLVCILLLIGMLVVLLFSLRQSQNQGGWASRQQIAPMFCFLIVYPIILIATATVISWGQEPINSRYMSPIYLPLIFLAVLSIDMGSEFLGQHDRNQMKRNLLLIAFGIWLIYPLSYSVGKMTYLARNGAGGFSSALWMNSNLIMYLKQHPLSGQVYSHSTDALYLLTGISAALSPRVYNYQSHNPVTGDLKQFRESLTASNKTYLAWFEGGDSSYLYKTKELESMFDLQVITAAPDGVLYLVKP